jgi:MYXO-CTERM domain-containing protein
MAAAAAGLDVEPAWARMQLDGTEVPFNVPVNIGELFWVEVTFIARGYVPANLLGVGAEACFGEDAILSDEYSPALDPQGYDDGLGGELYMAEMPPIPEPACAALLAAGALAALPRRRRRA